MQKKIILKCFQSPGDIVMLTSAVRDLKLAHLDIQVDVRTSADAIWEGNPHLTPLVEEDSNVEVLQMSYPLIHTSNEKPYHFIHGFRKFLEQKLQISIPATKFHGDIHITELEKTWMSKIEELGCSTPFWIVVAGGKYDFTAKWWNPSYFQNVIDHFKGKITFVQCGEEGHWHPKLNNVIDLVGQTDMRQFLRLVYHSSGVLCPVTFAMHAASAVPMKHDAPKNRPCVVVAGGREPAQWEQYPHHRYLSTNGCMPCCDNGGCWKSRCQLVGDGDAKDVENTCEEPVRVSNDLLIPKCMHIIKPQSVIDAIEMYYRGGALQYNTTTRASGIVEKQGDMAEKNQPFSEQQFDFFAKENLLLLAKEILKHAHKKQVKTIAEYGCVTGILAKQILDLDKNIIVKGVLPRQELHAEWEKNIDNDRFIPTMPSELKDIDFIYSIFTFQHIPAVELRDSIYRIYKCLNTEGVFVNLSGNKRMAFRTDSDLFFDDSFLAVDVKCEIARCFDLSSTCDVSYLQEYPSIKYSLDSYTKKNIDSELIDL